MMLSKFFAAMALSLALCGAAMAQDGAEITESRDAIVAQQTQLRAQVVAKQGGFKDLSQGERDELTAVQDRVLALLKPVKSIEELNADQRLTLFNDLQRVAAMAKNAEDNRKVCERTRAVGSNRYTVVCMTALEYERNKARAQDQMNRAQVCGRPPCGGGG